MPNIVLNHDTTELYPLTIQDLEIGELYACEDRRIYLAVLCSNTRGIAPVCFVGRTVWASELDKIRFREIKGTLNYS